MAKAQWMVLLLCSLNLFSELSVFSSFGLKGWGVGG